MAEISRAETAKIIRDLLRIAKVAMPGKLYEEDARVVVARAALGQLEAGSPTSRPPNVTSRITNVDLSKLTNSRPVELSSAGISFVLDLPWDLVDPLMVAQTELDRLDPAETVNFALRDWLKGQGYIAPAMER